MNAGMLFGSLFPIAEVMNSPPDESIGGSLGFEQQESFAKILQQLTESTETVNSEEVSLNPQGVEENDNQQIVEMGIISVLTEQVPTEEVGDEEIEIKLLLERILAEFPVVFSLFQQLILMLSVENKEMEVDNQNLKAVNLNLDMKTSLEELKFLHQQMVEAYNQIISIDKEVEGQKETLPTSHFPLPMVKTDDSSYLIYQTPTEGERRAREVAINVDAKKEAKLMVENSIVESWNKLKEAESLLLKFIKDLNDHTKFEDSPQVLLSDKVSINKLTVELQTLVNKAVQLFQKIVGNLLQAKDKKLEDYSSFNFLPHLYLTKKTVEKPAFTLKEVVKLKFFDLVGPKDNSAQMQILKSKPLFTLQKDSKLWKNMEFQDGKDVKSVNFQNEDGGIFTKYLVNRSIRQNFEPEIAQANVRENIISSIVRSAVLIVKAGHSEMRLKLSPEHLGELHLQVIVEQGRIIAHFQTQSVAVKEILENSLPQLKQLLQNAGIEIDAFNVSLAHNFTTSQDSQQEVDYNFALKSSSNEVSNLVEEISQEQTYDSPFLSSRINYWA